MPSVASSVREELVQQLDDFSAQLRRTRDELVRCASTHGPDSARLLSRKHPPAGQGGSASPS